MTEREPEQKITYYLEMRSPDELKPPNKGLVDLDIRQVELPFPELNWLMHQVVGADYRWGGREDWGRAEWTAYVNRPGLQTWIAYVSGTPAGYFEVEKYDDGSVEILCFGLRKEFFGQGIGGTLLTEAVKRCWEMNASRVHLHTCTHDHPLALNNYQARGFKVVKTQTGTPNAAFQSRLFGES